MNEQIKIELDDHDIIKVYECLVIGKEYAQESLSNHVKTLGETSHKNKRIADYIRQDIDKFDIRIDIFKDKHDQAKKELEDFNRCYG